MLNTFAPSLSSPKGQELEKALAAVEDRLEGLSDALRDRNADAIEQQATELHRTLAAAVNRFALAARQGGVPTELRRRLALASGQVAAQRESLARATAALDRAIDVLMPGMAGVAGTSLYGAAGTAERAAHSGVIQA